MIQTTDRRMARPLGACADECFDRPITILPDVLAVQGSEERLLFANGDENFCRGKCLMEAIRNFVAVITSVQRITAKVLMRDDRNKRLVAASDFGFEFGPHGRGIEPRRVRQNEVLDRFTRVY